MKASQTRTIAGIEYSITQMPARKGTHWFYRLMGVLGPAATKLGGLGKGSTAQSLTMADLMDNVDELGAAVEVIYEKLPPEEFEEMRQAFFWSLERKDAKGFTDLSDANKFDVELAGEVFTVLKLMAFAIEVNFGDFFGVLRARIAKAVAAKQAAVAAALAQGSGSPASTT